MSNPILKFQGAARSKFLAVANSRVNAYFREANISKQANAEMWVKAGVYLVAFFGLYALIISNAFTPWAMFGFAVALGIVSACVGFNVCHDAIHGSFSENKTVNKMLGSIFYLLGANPYVWSISHNMVHHNFTNIPGHDEDIEIAPGLIRITSDEPIFKVQKFQHLYAFPLYSLASLSWLFRKDFKKFFQPTLGPIVKNHPKIEYFNLFFYKAVYVFLFIVLPLIFLDVTWYQFIFGFIALHFAQGLTMGLVFQLAHVVEGTDFPIPNDSGNIEENWAEHQMQTTANFSTQSRVAGFLLGGLNRQIEHHLFPTICHIHYPKIGEILKETATEFGIPYIEHRTFLCALRSHYKVLKKFGNEARVAA
ncbi:acyl-CoA desaturase [Flavobacterium sp.]|uniref:fatty acid desaturase family protein n=1 Tax=Flavobacterium sp. TaxID=239 RepID=UPI00121CEAF1|nr:acyl-CoA desaturase [Flavobacterium sp.]RZJ70579.1 MAG: acyl-CoA desaturase [Flavobacterium sp.]